MPPKRKAKDAVSPNPRAPPRARSARGPKASVGSDETDIDILPTKPTKRARGAAARAAKQDDDFDDDLGNYGRWEYFWVCLDWSVSLIFVKQRFRKASHHRAAPDGSEQEIQGVHPRLQR